MKTPAQPRHGMVRGLSHVPRSPSFEGRFGRMFRSLPAAEFRPEILAELAKAMTAEREDPPTPETERDPEENTGISAGITYLGQFIDHDLTFDPSSSLQKQNDPDALVDFRSPRFDLDSVYGRGPDDQPYLYAADGVRMLLGSRLTGSPKDPNARDVPRSNPAAGPKRAIIGDPRNDENVIVAQLHAVFLRFHNRVAERLQGADFETVQRFVRWHYQWVVLHDFLPTIVETETLQDVLPHLKNGTTLAADPPRLRFFRWRNEPFIPVEFSVAAYRFGHSMVRPQYRLNTTLPGRFDIFAKSGLDLAGFREYPREFAIDWSLFFRMQAPPKDVGKERLQPAYKIDSSLVNPLALLPAIEAPSIPVLAHRNLLRGLSMGLPSGQSVARRMGVDPIEDEHLRVGKATERNSATNVILTDISAEFGHNAPLWFYILAEAQQQFRTDVTPIRLGPVGGRIVAEVLVGLLLGDRHSFLSMNPEWRPFDDFTRHGQFAIGDFVARALEARESPQTHVAETAAEPVLAGGRRATP
ncbi:MAG: heme peroxidase [Candidatus Eisenbacteria bacterium]|uniref:Heme peroxidase n=1 Tax=Eiseniibacteriota bacterium TaxID=2212470 RepID=A0A538SI66_UNCEI|nr:MAG: heme peroxidase [Candidatus Eisenbacteria bacterium]